MKNCRIVVGFMVVFFVACLSLSASVHAGRSDDDSSSGHKKKGNKLPEHAHVLQQQIDNIASSPWSDTTDGYNSISTIGSINIGDDQNRDYCDTRNEGTIRYNTDTNTFEGCDGTEWVSLSSQGGGDGLYAIGDNGPAGGIVFYITDGGLHGLEAAPAHQNSDTWDCWGTSVPGASGTAVGTGKQNTSAILAVGCTGGRSAAVIVTQYLLNGYDDWFLPSKYEMVLLGEQRDVIGDIVKGTYWTSSNVDGNMVWTVGVPGGPYDPFPSHMEKRQSHHIRAIREF
jgi:hypothetical protein